ncbi:MAG: hypothetical protein COX91_00050 [Candidatus Nealsonbacteria bacterium CG_4_10_14_0_2_um_filter_39_15]|uniref:Uncharacterized protein n=1 Tax=Candidatus Nealsonbacteria bacterium CG_4_10_14_0_2_um_filter_39_15 TaxID=1974681 RepID=A0A2M7UX20_9BACT|nr:MAG: hypothetical protein COX91_00050 [Candidatus Nealsonbacteria bacterium CG_4_10_14_0_2_um_filter_39_15]
MANSFCVASSISKTESKLRAGTATVLLAFVGAISTAEAFDAGKATVPENTTVAPSRMVILV